MAMSMRARKQLGKMLSRGYTPSNKPDPGNLAIFFEESCSVAHAGIVLKWPLFVPVETEAGDRNVKLALSERFAGSKVKFFAPNPAGKSQRTQ